MSVSGKSLLNNAVDTKTVNGLSMPVLSRYLSAGLVVTLGLSVTLAATAWVGRWERRSRQSEFQKQTSNLTTALQRTINRYNELLLSIGDLYDATDNQVTVLTFRQFVQRAVATFPGIQALEWAPVILHQDRASYESGLATRVPVTTPTITERDATTEALVVAGIRDRYVPVTFIEPWRTNEAALGYDLTSDQTRRIALERARDTGAIAATGRIQLVQETAQNQYSFLVFVPVYRQPASTPEGRRQQVSGYILGVFRVADVVEEALANLNYDIDFYVFDQTARPGQQLLGGYDAQTQQLSAEDAPLAAAPPTVPSLCATAADCTRRIQLGQREWQLAFTPSEPTPWPWSAIATLLVGLLITATLLVYLSRWQSELRRTRELSNLKLRLFSMASHELRTPLSVITVSAQSLATDQNHLTPQQQADTITRIQLAAQRMGQLVSDSLTLARAEAGKLEFTPEIVELAPFCRQLCEQVRLKIGQTLVLEGNAAKTRAYVDKKLLHSILVNLLSNAAKYSPEASPIRLVISETDQQLQFQVIDHGIGIAPEAQAHILEAFYRGNNVGDAPGIGLGLSVVKTCIELHGGTLTITSHSDTGTCFAVCLPRIE